MTEFAVSPWRRAANRAQEAYQLSMQIIGTAAYVLVWVMFFVCVATATCTMISIVLHALFSV